MTVGGLFSGIGGFDEGFLRAGFQLAWQVENDRYANQILSRHYPETIRYGDIRKTHPAQVGSTDVVTAGFPCQDLSIAGTRRGLDGDRSGLYFQILRFIDALAPPWVVLENVPHLLRIHRGRDFATLLQTLVQRRYCVAWRVLDSRYFGVPQQRKRVFVVGSLGNDRAGEVLFESESSPGDAPPRERDSWLAPCLTGCPVRYDANDGLVWHERGREAVTPSTVAQAFPASRCPTYESITDRFRLRRFTPVERERLQGFPDGWTDGLSETQRSRLLGNAVTVPVAEWIANRILSQLKKELP